MESAEIRRRFLSTSRSAGTPPVPSASLIVDDPTLLFVNAGMVPFKPYFLGQETPPYPRATSVQKCVRTPDIEEVGKTTRHGTFFQMCGNFSFGDYFKEGAIELRLGAAHQPLADGGFGFDRRAGCGPRSTRTTTRRCRSGSKVVGVPAERIQRLGMKDNYWSMGVPGPGGPCSEIYYDRGPEFGRARAARLRRRGPLPGGLEPRLHAVRARRGARQGGLRHPRDLPRKNIDTGMGLERVADLLQGVENMYEIDTMSRSSTGPRS